jgi:TonB family protein
LKSTSEKEPPSPARASAATPVPAEAAKPDATGIPSAKGEVLDQILPDVPQKARDTIRGRVRVSINVHVDQAGTVSGAELDSPGPSQYFSDLALQAARRWAFTPPEVNGKSVASEWNLRFVFTQDNTKVTPTQTAP